MAAREMRVWGVPGMECSQWTLEMVSEAGF